MTLWCCVNEDRPAKSRRIMQALAAGVAGGTVIDADPPAGDEPFVVSQMLGQAERVVPPALKTERRFWHVDNGWRLPARGTEEGFYRLTYRGLSPRLLDSPPWPKRTRVRPLAVAMAPWRKTGKHILVAMPGIGFGRPIGLDMIEWRAWISRNMRTMTDRPVVFRSKTDVTPLADQLVDCWALVTHSSNAAIDAVIAGVPVFVAETSPAAPVGRTDFEFEKPATWTDREAWWASLMCQQFTLDEMRSGMAWEGMRCQFYCHDRSG